MRVPSAPRRTGARNKPVHFTYLPIEPNAPFEAYTAGPIWWGPLHMLKPSKPCVYEITSGAVRCRFCASSKRPLAVMKGWVPVYRRQETLAQLVCVDEAQRDQLDALALHTKVVVGRGKGKGVGVYVQLCTNPEPKYVTTLPERQVAADVTESLLTMWNIPELNSFFGRAVASDNPLSLAAGADGAAQQRGEVTTEEARECIDHEFARQRGGVDDAVARVLKHAKDQGTLKNGKH